MRTFLDDDVQLTQKQSDELDKVSGFAEKNQKLSWSRKKKRIDELVERVQPIENKIMDLIREKQPILDQIDEVRDKMVKECVHPKDHLSHRGDHVLCRFCQRKINVA